MHAEHDATPAATSPAPPRERAALTRLIVLASASWVRLALTFLTGFIITPLLLGTLGTDLFGLFMLVSLTITASDPIMAVINKSCNRELTAAVSARDDTRLRKVFTNSVALGALASLVSMSIPLTLAAIAPLVFNFDPAHDLRVRTALLTEGVVIFSFVVLTPWSNLYWATQRVVAENATRVIARLLDLVAVGLAYALPADPFYVFAFSRAGLQVTLIVARSVWIRARVPAARFRRDDLDAASVKSMARTGGWAFGEFVGRFGFYDADHILVNLFRGPVYNAINSIINQLRGYTRLVGVSMLFGVESIAADLHERGKVDTLRRVIVSSTAQCFALVGFCCVISAAFFGPLLDCWLGGILRKDPDLLRVMSYAQARDFAWTFLALALPGLLFGESHSGAANMLYGMGRIRAYAPIVMGAAAIRLVVVIALLANGASPMVLSGVTTIVLVIVYGGYFPWLLSRTVEMPLGAFAWRTYIRPLLSLIPIALVAWWMSVSLAPWSLVKIALCCAALGMLYAPIAFCFVFDAHERSRIRGLAPTILARLGLGRTRAASLNRPAP